MNCRQVIASTCKRINKRTVGSYRTVYARCEFSIHGRRKAQNYSLSSSRSTHADTSQYIDKWFASIVKPQSFYDHFGHDVDDDVTSSLQLRRYFYNVDLQGRLFLEETLPKNIATSIKDERFLNFFFRRIRKTRPDELAVLDAYGDGTIDGEENKMLYPFVSLCGKEVNYIRPAAVPIVFHSLQDGRLIYGGSLWIPFDVHCLAVSQHTGQLYHNLESQNKKERKGQQSLRSLGFGLVRSSIAVTLSEHIVPTTADGCERLGYVTSGNEIIPLPWLPSDCEPGAWAMPGD